MEVQATDQEVKAAKVPHDLLMVNLIGNHILWFVASLGVMKSYWQPLALVPIVSITILSYILIRARQTKNSSSWYIYVNWQIAAQRSKVFLILFITCIFIASFGVYGFMELNWMKEAVIAYIGGTAILPIMATTLTLIILESDSLHQVSERKVADKMVEKYPKF